MGGGSWPPQNPNAIQPTRRGQSRPLMGAQGDEEAVQMAVRVSQLVMPSMVQAFRDALSGVSVDVGSWIFRAPRYALRNVEDRSPVIPAGTAYNGLYYLTGAQSGAAYPFTLGTARQALSFLAFDGRSIGDLDFTQVQQIDVENFDNANKINILINGKIIKRVKAQSWYTTGGIDVPLDLVQFSITGAIADCDINVWLMTAGKSGGG